MDVLIACESSGVVRNAFRWWGFNAWSCDLLPAEDGSPFHYQEDAIEVAFNHTWDLVIAHPPCTYIATSGIHWNKRVAGRQIKTEEAAKFFLAFTELPCAWALENPKSIMSRLYRKPDQIIQPYNFGHNASKTTCLWLNKLPLLQEGIYVPPRLVEGLKRWDNQLDSGENRLGRSRGRSKARSRTYQGIAEAMAYSWGLLNIPLSRRRRGLQRRESSPELQLQRYRS